MNQLARHFGNPRRFDAMQRRELRGLDGRHIIAITADFHDLWRIMKRSAASIFECDLDDVDTYEDDDGREIVTVCGKPVGELVG